MIRVGADNANGRGARSMPMHWSQKQGSRPSGGADRQDARATALRVIAWRPRVLSLVLSGVSSATLAASGAVTVGLVACSTAHAETFKADSLFSLGPVEEP